MILATLFLLTNAVYGQKSNPQYDAELAKTLGADAYGMKSYVLAILRSGPNKTQDKSLRDSLFAGHFRNINRLADLGKLVVAGPFETNANSYRGIFILDVTTFEEANLLLKDDPTIREKIFEVDLYNWYGSAALPEYLKVHKKIGKLKIE